MGTRGTFGYRIKNKNYVFFSGSDSYPSSLGHYVVNYIKQVGLKNNKSMLETFKKTLLSNMDFSSEEIEDLNGSELYELLKRKVKVENAEEFLKDSLFCEYSYIINLDDGTLDVFTHGQNDLVDQIPFNLIQSDALDHLVERIKLMLKIQAEDGSTIVLHRLEFSDPAKNSNKFYEISLKPDKNQTYQVTGTWGKVGAESPTSKTYFSGDLIDCMNAANELRLSKENKGYKTVKTFE